LLIVQGQSINILLLGITENRWTESDIELELATQIKESRTKGHYREGQRSSYLTVAKIMGTKYDKRESDVWTGTGEVASLSANDALSLVTELNEVDPHKFGWHIKTICELYGFPMPLPTVHEKILRIEGQGFTEDVLFQHDHKGWKIKDAPASFAWLMSISLAEIPTKLSSHGCTWAWV